MPFFYRLTLELHDSLYYATREIGRLYETEPILHNYALCYALGFVDSEKYGTVVDNSVGYRYFCGEQVPRYEAHLTALNQRGLYVTPARAVQHTTTLNTWKYADNRYHVEMKKTQKNIPSFGRTKEIAPESLFECFVVSSDRITFPKWIRLGKWLSKTEVTATELPKPKQTTAQEYTFPYPLNPLDVMFTNQVLSYDTINMPPVSLIQHVHLKGDYYTFPNTYDSLKLPANLSYHFSS